MDAMKHGTAPFLLAFSLLFSLCVFPFFDGLLPLSAPPQAAQGTVAGGNAALPLPREKIDTKHYPKIASWLGKKQEIIQSGKPYSLVMSGWFTPEEAGKLREQSPGVKLLAGLSLNWVWDNPQWMTFLKDVANYGKSNKIENLEEMYLKRPNGKRVAFGWESKEWNQQEIYAMDPKNPLWVEFITTFYRNVLAQPQHDGIIVDMVTERSWSPDVIGHLEWVNATQAIMKKIQEMNTEHKLVIFNSGRNLSEIDAYGAFMDGYVMENFSGKLIRSTFKEGMEAAAGNYIVIYAMDTDDTGKKDLKKMRLGLTLSLLYDHTYFSYDLGPRDHGQAWWFPEYDVILGSPLGDSFLQEGGYMRRFEKGLVVCSPYKKVDVRLDREHTDCSTGTRSRSFQVPKGDGRIFLLTNP
jgi:hypothetical protein